MSRIIACLLRLGGALVLAAAVVVPTAVALAASPEDSAAARAHFETGERHYDLREYEDALRSFKDAYRVVPDPVLLYNIGQCHWKLDNRREAVDFYRQYLRRLPTAPNRSEVQARVRELEKELAAEPQRAPVPTAPAAAPTRPIPPAASARTAAAVAPLPAARPTWDAPSPASSDATSERVVPTTDVGAAAAEPTDEPTPIYKRWWLWTAVGVAVVAGAVAVGLAASGRTEVGDCRMVVPCVRVGP